MDVILILSGGIDSTTLLYDLISQGETVHPISFDYGQKHSKELMCAAQTCEDLNISLDVLDISSICSVFVNCSLVGKLEPKDGFYDLKSMESTVVPNRNMIMLSIAIAQAITSNISHVYYGAHLGDSAVYPDCRTDFVQRMQNVSEVCHYTPIHIHAPYINLNKSDIIRKGAILGVAYQHTWTCYTSKDSACGMCGGCHERLEAFREAGMPDPIRYS